MTKKQLENATKIFNDTITKLSKIPAFKKRVNLEDVSIKIEDIPLNEYGDKVDGITYIWGDEDGRIIKREIAFDYSIYKEMNKALLKFYEGLALEENGTQRIVGFMHEVGHTREKCVNDLEKGSKEYFLSEGLNEIIARLETAFMIKDRYSEIENDEVKNMLNNLDSWVNKNGYYNKQVKTIENALSRFGDKLKDKIYNDMKEKLIKTKHERIFKTMAEVMSKYSIVKATLSMRNLEKIEE